MGISIEIFTERWKYFTICTINSLINGSRDFQGDVPYEYFLAKLDKLYVISKIFTYNFKK